MRGRCPKSRSFILSYRHIPCECEEDYKKPTNHPSTIIKKKLKSKVQLPESPFTPIMSATQYISCSLTSHNRLKHFVLKCKYFCFLDNIGDKSKTFLLQNCINIVLSLTGCKPLLPWMHLIISENTIRSLASKTGIRFVVLTKQIKVLVPSVVPYTTPGFPLRDHGDRS